MRPGTAWSLLHGRAKERNLSDREFWPTFEAGEALQAPLHLHPQSLQQGVVQAYYSGLGPAMARALSKNTTGEASMRKLEKAPSRTCLAQRR
jgi:hypothetical protein